MNHHTGHVTDFDFLTGTWHVANRRLRERLVGCDQWDAFDGTGHCEPRLGGVVNVDELRCPGHGLNGMAVRAFDVAASQWSIHWIDHRWGRLEPPVRGGFDGPVGVFLGPDEHRGVDVTCRFTWEVLAEDRARWTQAFSVDGTTWEDNWTMDFHRLV